MTSARRPSDAVHWYSRLKTAHFIANLRQAVGPDLCANTIAGHGGEGGSGVDTDAGLAFTTSR